MGLEANVGVMSIKGDDLKTFLNAWNISMKHKVFINLVPSNW